MYPKKKKLGDLDVEEVVELLGIKRDDTVTEDESSLRGGFYPRIQPKVETTAPTFVPQDATNYGQGRIIENDAFAPQVPQSAPQTPAQAVETFYPKVASQSALEQEYARRRELQTTGAKKERSLGKRLLEGALRGLATGGLGGAVTGAAVEGFYPKANTKLRTQAELAETNQNIKDLQQEEAFTNTVKDAEARRENLKRDDERRQKEFEQNIDFKNRDLTRKEKDRELREKTARMTQVAGMFKNLPSYDPADPRFAEITKALGDVNLPITPKDAKKKVDLKQDQRTGEWTVVLTDEISGKQEVRSVMKDGKVFASTPTVVMQGEYGMLRQNDQQEFTAQENEKNRELRRQAIDISRERLGVARENLRIAQENLARAQGSDKQKAETEVRKAKETLIRLKAYIKNNPLISGDEDILGDLADLEGEQ